MEEDAAKETASTEKKLRFKGRPTREPSRGGFCSIMAVYRLFLCRNQVKYKADDLAIIL